MTREEQTFDFNKRVTPSENEGDTRYENSLSNPETDRESDAEQNQAPESESLQNNDIEFIFSNLTQRYNYEIGRKNNLRSLAIFSLTALGFLVTVGVGILGINWMNDNPLSSCSPFMYLLLAPIPICFILAILILRLVEGKRIIVGWNWFAAERKRIVDEGESIRGTVNRFIIDLKQKKYTRKQLKAKEKRLKAEENQLRRKRRRFRDEWKLLRVEEERLKAERKEFKTKRKQLCTLPRFRKESYFWEYPGDNFVMDCASGNLPIIEQGNQCQSLASAVMHNSTNNNFARGMGNWALGLLIISIVCGIIFCILLIYLPK